MGCHTEIGKPPQEMRALDAKASCRPGLHMSPCPLAHELRNSLSVVTGHCELLAAEIDSEELRKHLDAMSGAAWSMAEILRRCRSETCEKRASTVEGDPLHSSGR